jgi:hypothetical protein
MKDPLNLVFGIIGILPFLGTLSYTITRWRRGRRILRFASTGTVDVVLTTSEEGPPKQGIAARRPLTGYGQVRAVASCTRAMTRLYNRKRLSLHLSGFARHRFDKDLIVLGGPVKNFEARRRLEGLVKDYDLQIFVFDDNEARCLQIINHDGTSFDEKYFSPEMVEGYPVSDFGIVVLSHHKGKDGKEFRWVLCAGFTTYGTAAAAEFLFADLVRMSRRRARKLLRVGPLTRVRDVLIVVKGSFEKGECTQVECHTPMVLRKRKPVRAQPQKDLIGLNAG